jgi:tetratricopeptide (TPR) repeat protein
LLSAEASLKQCIQASPAPLDAYLQLCAVYQFQQKPDALYQTAMEGLKRFPQEKRFYIAAGTHEGQLRRYDQAIHILEEGYRLWAEDEKIRSLLASSYFARGVELLDATQNQAAAENLRRATQLAPDDVEAQLNLGRALHNLLRNTEALAAFERVIALNANLPLARFHRGLSFYSLGEFDKAIQDLTLEIDANLEYAPARLVRGLALMATGEWERALFDVDAATASMPENPKAHYSRARTLIQLGRLEDAEASLRKAVALDAFDPAPVNTLVTVLLRLNRGSEAEPLARRAAELSRDRRSANPGEIRFESFRRSPR